MKFISPFRTIRVVKISVVILMAFIVAALFPACTDDKAQESAQVQALRKKVRRDLEIMAYEVEPLLASAREGEIPAALMRLTSGEKAATHGMAVMSPDGNVIAARFPSAPGMPGPNATQAKYHYGKYRFVSEALEERRFRQDILHLPGVSIYAVGMPVIRGDSLLGCICVGYPAETIEKKLGVTREEFLKMDFGS